MISTITFLYTAIVPLGGLLGSWMLAPPGRIERPLALAVALVGFLLSGLSLALVWYFSAHMRRSRAMSEKVLAACRGLKDNVDRLRAASLSKELDDYREEAQRRDKMVWLNPKRLFRVLFRVEPIFLMLSFVTAAWFAFGCCWAYFS
jgi:hypothetical protein